MPNEERPSRLIVADVLPEGISGDEIVEALSAQQLKAFIEVEERVMSALRGGEENLGFEVQLSGGRQNEHRIERGFMSRLSESGKDPRTRIREMRVRVRGEREVEI